MKRHIGKISNTDQRCIVCYMQIPGREDHALVVQSDTLPSRFEQALMEIVESKEGQANPVLANVLAAHLMPELNKSVFQALHETGLLRAVHIDQIVMLPEPNMPFPLRTILEQMGSPPAPLQETAATPQEKHNQHNENLSAQSVEQRAAIARNLLVEADLLQQDVNRKRREAYKIAPELEPKVNAETAPKVETKTATKQTAKAKTTKPKTPRVSTKKVGG